MADHGTLSESTGSTLHEPKGAATASLGQRYESDGAGSGVWAFPSVNPADFAGNEEKFLRVSEDGLNVDYQALSPTLSLSAFSTVNQNPAGLDIPMQASFGAPQTTSDIDLDANGLITFLKDGTYIINTITALGRTGGTGVSELFQRVLFGGIQVGGPQHYRFDDADVTRTTFTTFIVPAVIGQTITFETYRDSAGNNSGGLVATASNLWGTAPSASITIQRFGA